MNVATRHADILIVGAGPAGMAAAVRAAENGAEVMVLDDNPFPGGQIWRNERNHSSTPEASRWFRELKASSLQILVGARVISADAQGRVLLAETDAEAFKIRYDTLVLAIGARELFLPFPGWTLPNIMGVGGLQALVKSGLPLEHKRIIVAGSGPLLLAAAAYFRKRGAIVPLIAEQSSWRRILGFGVTLIRNPAKLWHALRLRISLGRTRYLPGCWVTAAEGSDNLTGVRLLRGVKTWVEPCDYLAVAYGLVPNTELAALLGCEIRDGAVRVNELQQTSVPGVFCAGEPTGIGGLDLSLIEGEIAGYAATGRPQPGSRLIRAQAAKHTVRHRPGARLCPAGRIAYASRCRYRDLPLRRRDFRPAPVSAFLALGKATRSLRHGPVSRTSLRPDCPISFRMETGGRPPPCVSGPA